MADILIVDDEQITLMNLKEELQDLGHTVVGVAKTGPIAVKKAKSLKPELILMDISMPGSFDGIEAARRIEENLSAPVIFITAYESEHYLKKIKTIGPFGYLNKPYKKIELEACIYIALYRKIMENQLQSQIDNEILINNILSQISLEMDPFDKIPSILTGVAKNLKISKICLCELHGEELENVGCVCDKKLRKKKSTAQCPYNYFKNTALKDSSAKIIIDDLDNFCKKENLEKDKFDFRSILYIPIYIEENQFGGMLFIKKEETGYFTPELERLLTIVGKTISIILEKHYKFLRIKRIEEDKHQKEKMIMRANRFISLGQLSSSISHEISQPLHKIKILADSAIYWEKNNKKVAYSDLMDSLKKISAYVTHIDRIIKNLKLLIKSPEKIKQHSTNINSVIRQSLEMYNQKMINHRIYLSTKLNDSIEDVSLSGVLCQQIIINLVENAINAHDTVEKDNKWIKIETSKNKNNTLLRCIDNGPGVDNTIRQEIFQPFYSGNHNYQTKGMGMGLYIVHNILELINGSIEVKDNKYGGATFKIKFEN